MVNWNDTAGRFTSLNALKTSLGLPLAAKFHVKTITTADMVTAGTTETIDIKTDDNGVVFPADANLLYAGVDLRTVVAGGTISACTAAIGDTADVDQMLDESDVFTGATLGWTYDPGAVTFGGLEAPAYLPLLTLAFTGGNSDTATTGDMVCYVAYVKPDDPTNTAADD